MSATDELRRMMDERGVEWTAPESYNGSYDHDTIVGEYWYHEYDGKLTVHGLTPEQAIEATLGRGTCHDIGYRIDSTRFKCSQCGWDGWVRHAKDGRDYKPLWCPLCGAKVVTS